MKKILIVLAVCLSLLCGCSGGNEIFWGETIESDGWEFTITDIEFREQYSYSSTLYKPEPGSIFIGVEYMIKNISKGEKYFSPESSMMRIDYDEYIFDLDRGWQLSNVGWVQSGEELKPLSEPVRAKMYFQVPLEVKDSVDKELKIVVNLGKKYVCSVRPLHDNSLQGKYDKAVKQIENEEYGFAISKLEEMGDYKDSKEKLEIAREGYRFVGAAMNENIAYFSDNKEKYEKISPNQISGLTNNTWDLSKYGLPVEFKENGELYNAHIKYEDIHWIVEEDFLVIDYKKYNKVDKFEIRKFSEDKYLLYVGQEFMYTLERPY